MGWPRKSSGANPLHQNLYASRPYCGTHLHRNRAPPHRRSTSTHSPHQSSKKPGIAENAFKTRNHLSSLNVRPFLFRFLRRPRPQLSVHARSFAKGKAPKHPPLALARLQSSKLPVLLLELVFIGVGHVRGNIFSVGITGICWVFPQLLRHGRPFPSEILAFPAKMLDGLLFL